jgi:hypothetical protein
VIQTLDGGYALTGDMHRDTVTPGAHNTVLLKTDPQGNLQWAHLYGSNPGAEVGYDLLQVPDSGYLILGNSDFYGMGAEDILILRTDASGNLQWARTYGGTMKDDGWQIRKNGSGYVIAAATENFSANGVWDTYVLSLDSAFSDSCNSISVSPEEGIPFLQQRRGAVITSGGTTGNPATVENTVTLAVFDPCSPVSTEDINQNEFSAVLYPNPSPDGKFTVYSTQSTGYIQIFDVFGKRIFEKKLNSEIEWLRINVAGGIYFYTITSPNGQKATGKLVIE